MASANHHIDRSGVRRARPHLHDPLASRQQAGAAGDPPNITHTSTSPPASTRHPPAGSRAHPRCRRYHAGRQHVVPHTTKKYNKHHADPAEPGPPPTTSSTRRRHGRSKRRQPRSSERCRRGSSGARATPWSPPPPAGGCTPPPRWPGKPPLRVLPRGGVGAALQPRAIVARPAAASAAKAVPNAMSTGVPTGAGMVWRRGDERGRV